MPSGAPGHLGDLVVGHQLASSALRHNAAHMGEAVTIRSLVGFALGT